MLDALLETSDIRLDTLSIADAELLFGVLSSADTNSLPGKIPLISARTRQLDPHLCELADAALQNYDMSMADMKVSFPRDRFFSRALRSCWLCPQQLRSEVSPDDMHTWSTKLDLAFALPSGSYATMVVRALTAGLEVDHA